MATTWADIPGIVGYQVTPLGEVRSHFENYGKPKVRKFQKNNQGYNRVNLRVNGQTKVYSVHRLVATTFIPNPEGKLEVNHIDGNKDNNSVENLEWVSRSENAKHAFVNGLSRGIWKAIAAHTKLTDEQVEEIKRAKGKVKPKDLSKQYGISIWTVYQIHAGTRRNVSTT